MGTSIGLDRGDHGGTLERGRVRARTTLELVLALTLSISWVSCSGDSGSGGVIAQPGPCSGAYSSAYNSCWSTVNCAGFECLYYTGYCGGQARVAVEACCAASYTDPTERQTCIDSLGRNP